MSWGETLYPKSFPCFVFPYFCRKFVARPAYKVDPNILDAFPHPNGQRIVRFLFKQYRPPTPSLLKILRVRYQAANSSLHSLYLRILVITDLQLCCFNSSCRPLHLPACVACRRLWQCGLCQKLILTTGRTVALADCAHAEWLSALGVRWALSCTHNEWRTLGLIILKTLDISIGGAAALRSRLCFHRHRTDVHTEALENCIWLTTRAPAAAQISVNNVHDP